MLNMKDSRGSAIADVLIFAAVVVFVILPVFSVIMEKYLILNKAQIVRDAADMAGISVYNAINTSGLGKAGVDVTGTEAEDIYRRVLAENLRLDGSLRPLPGSLAADTVRIRSLLIYSHGLPAACPEGVTLDKPSVHCVITVPVKPSLFRKYILRMFGRQYVDIEVHVDSEIPLNR